MNDKQFYIDRKQEMIDMRMNGFNDVAIGEHFNISRERVAQIIGRGRCLATKNRNRIITSYPEKTNKEVAEFMNLSDAVISSVRSHSFHVMGEGRNKHQTWMLWGKQYLIDHGYSVELFSSKHPYDALVNGKKVNVIAAMTPRTSPSLRFISPMYRFRVNPGADFYVLIVIPTKDIFVIPANEIPDNQKFIHLTHPTPYPKSKWHNFHNRLDLLD